MVRLFEKVGMAADAVEFHKLILHVVDEQPVRFDVAIPNAPQITPLCKWRCAVG